MHVCQRKLCIINNLRMTLNNRARWNGARTRRARKRKTAPAGHTMNTSGQGRTRIMPTYHIWQHINFYSGFLHKQDVWLLGLNQGGYIMHSSASPTQKIPADNLHTRSVMSDEMTMPSSGRKFNNPSQTTPHGAIFLVSSIMGRAGSPCANSMVNVKPMASRTGPRKIPTPPNASKPPITPRTVSR